MTISKTTFQHYLIKETAKRLQYSKKNQATHINKHGQ